MDTPGLTSKKIAILGFGLENRSLLNWLISHGAKDITICDKNDSLQSTGYKLQTKYQLGAKYLNNLDKFDIIFRTPGISPLTPELVKAKKKGVEISSQMKLFFDMSPAKIIGVTGTKGKGTTVSLITEILKSNAKRQKVYSGGNIGNAPIDFLDKLNKNDWVVLELSSFQLQDMKKSPQIAVVLDIEIDHLDYHKNRSEYVSAKENIVRWQKKSDYAVINLDYLTSFKFAEISPSVNDYYFSRRKSVDLGAFVEWTPKTRGAHFGKIILRTNKKDYEICKTFDIILRGEHNLENICAAITASYLAGATINNIKKAVTQFRGLPYRLQYEGEKDGVKFYNDSASTNPQTTIAAIKSFSEPIILISGGSDKGANYSQLKKELTKSSVKTIIAIGVTGPKIVEKIKNPKLKIKIIRNLKNMREIVRAAKKESKSGDIVLLSPASASFGMFKNYKDRGKQFKEQVLKIRNKK